MLQEARKGPFHLGFHSRARVAEEPPSRHDLLIGGITVVCCINCID